MSGDGALTESEAHAVYDVLVDYAGEYDPDGHERKSFVHAQTRGRCVEYRFQGVLGFGGKFWNDGAWYVNCYREDRTAERESVIRATNAALSGLYAVRPSADSTSPGGTS